MPAPERPLHPWALLRLTALLAEIAARHAANAARAAAEVKEQRPGQDPGPTGSAG